MWYVEVAHCISLNYLHINTELLNHILWHTSSPLLVFVHYSHKEIFQRFISWVCGRWKLAVGSALTTYTLTPNF